MEWTSKEIKSKKSQEKRTLIFSMAYSAAPFICMGLVWGISYLLGLVNKKADGQPWEDMNDMLAVIISIFIVLFLGALIFPTQSKKEICHHDYRDVTCFHTGVFMFQRCLRCGRKKT